MRIINTLRLVLVIMLLFLQLRGSYAQEKSPLSETWKPIRENIQKSFPTEVPPADYSGITRIAGSQYAVVDDKSVDDGFEMFTINIDSLSGDIISVVYDGHVAGKGANRDQEDIAYVASRNTLLISGEADNMIIEYDLDGRQTGRATTLPQALQNLGYEALAYSDSLHVVWTVTESTLPLDGEIASPRNKIANRLRLQQRYDDLRLMNEYYYLCELPQPNYNAWRYANGISALAVLPDGSLLVLEREFYVPELFSGAYCTCRLFNVSPTSQNRVSPSEPIRDDSIPMEKRLVTEWKTTLSFFRSNLANYEGMCLGPVLADGSQVIILLSDSQSQYGGVLKDYFKTIVISKQPQE